jgi:hypothetical protein
VKKFRWKVQKNYFVNRKERKEKVFQSREREKGFEREMPNTTELRESAEQVTARLQALTSRSMQQVRGFASRGVRTIRGSLRRQKSENASQHWSTSSLSDKNSQNQDSSKTSLELELNPPRSLVAHVEREITEHHAF